MSDDAFDYVDHAFARALAPDDQRVQTVLAMLLAHGRAGHLCMESDESLPAGLVTHADQLDPLPSTPLVRVGRLLYLQRLWLQETLFIRGLQELLGREPEVECQADGHIDQLLAEGRLQSEQALAIRRALSQSVTCITGGPGTGKTYTAGHLINMLHLYANRPLKFALAAPTGKAAAALQDNLGRLCPGIAPARTLHSLLGIRPYRLSDPLDPPVALEADVILVDESSMIDVVLMTRLVASVRPGTRLILLGDKDQLPPVEAGCLFGDLTSGVLGDRVVALGRCMRTDLRQLTEFAAAVNGGQGDRAWSLLQEGGGLRHVALRDWQAHVEGTRVLCPLRQGPMGVDRLNQQLRLRFRSSEVPIMVTANDPRLELYNGEMGTLVQKNPGGVLERGDYALFQGADGTERRIPALALPRFEQAYCLSVHKSQGSEYDNVLLLLPEGSERFGREVLYTAATRARKRLVVAGDEAVIRDTIANTSQRRSGVAERMLGSVVAI